MKVSVYIVVEMYKGEKCPLLRIDSSAYWDKALADDYAAAQNAHLKKLNIESSKFTIKEVAISCGHTGDQSSFSKLFKAIHKLAPEEWTRKNACPKTILLMETKINKCI